MSWQFYYWGPLLFRTKLNNEDVQKLKSICHKDKKKDFRKKLAGIINHEYEIDNQSYINVMIPYLNYFQEALLEWYGCKKINKIEVTAAWVNYMKAGEFNPPHMHPECDFSSVVFLDIPKELEEENSKYVGTAEGPGSLQFMCGEPMKHSINQKTFFPENGDFFMFPGILRHLVFPFTSNVERISLAANYLVDIKIHNTDDNKR